MSYTRISLEDWLRSKEHCDKGALRRGLCPALRSGDGGYICSYYGEGCEEAMLNDAYQMLKDYEVEDKTCQTCKYFDVDEWFCVYDSENYVDKSENDSCEHYESWE